MQKAKGKGGFERTTGSDDYADQMETVPQRHPGRAVAGSRELAHAFCFERGQPAEMSRGAAGLSLSLRTVRTRGQRLHRRLHITHRVARVLWAPIET